MPPVALIIFTLASTTGCTSAVSTVPGYAKFAGATSPEALNLLLRSGQLVIREDTFNALGYSFNSGNSVGVGRIALGAKGVVYADDRFRLALAGQFFCPSPSEAEFAGPDNAAIFPRVVGQVKALDFLFFTSDLGYEYDFGQAELSRFAWDVGAWIPGKRFSVDFGVGGPQYDTSIRWTPSVTTGSTDVGTFTLRALGNNAVGTTFVDFLGGVKFRLAEQLVLSGAVTVPLTSDGFRPDALGTLALELHF